MRHNGSMCIPDTSSEHVSGCPEQTIVKQGSSVFCAYVKVPKPSGSINQPTQWARRGSSTDFVRGGGNPAHGGTSCEPQ